MGAFVGIDLGTTTSEVAIYQNGKLKILADNRGNEIVESYVGIDNKTREISVGEKVKSIYISHPELCVEQIKRKMGQNTTIRLGDKEFTPEEISAFILKHLKTAAENQLGEVVDRAVITVPANFPDPARVATIQAGEIAGMKVERIINEPTAAALAYGHDAGIEEEMILVYDLGGGTFDVTVGEFVGENLDVKASAGDPHLGGKDFDLALLNYLRPKIEKDHGFTVQNNTGEYYRLLFACEMAKKELSFNFSTTINIPFFALKDGNPVSLEYEVTRAELEKLIRPMIDRTEKSIHIALRDAGVKPEHIHRILLIGGSTRIPYVKEMIKRVFNKEPLQLIDPDRAVAMGAAKMAAIISGQVQRIAVMDVCPLSLGTSAVTELGGMLVKGVYSEIIKPNTPCLKACEHDYATLFDDQEEIDFRIYQKNNGVEETFAEIDDKPNIGFTLLDRIEVKLDRSPKGTLVKAIYTYNQNGVLHVEISTQGKRIKRQVTLNKSDYEIQRSREKIETLWQESKYYNDVKALIHAAEKELLRLKPDKKLELEQMLSALKKALAENNLPQIKILEESITNFLFE